MACEPFSVSLEVTAPDQLTHIVFGIAMICNSDGTEQWKINFELNEKQQVTDPTYVQVAKVAIVVGPEDQPAAAAVARQKSLSDAQAAQALNAADTLKAHVKDPQNPAVKGDVTAVLAMPGPAAAGSAGA
jgi:hypothetical protein